MHEFLLGFGCHGDHSPSVNQADYAPKALRTGHLYTSHATLHAFAEEARLAMMEVITVAGNTEVPAYLALQQLGLLPRRCFLENGTELWTGENESGRYSASSPLELLGLYLMRQIRGGDWKATDEEINNFLAAFYPDALSS